MKKFSFCFVLMSSLAFPFGPKPPSNPLPDPIPNPNPTPNPNPVPGPEPGPDPEPNPRPNPNPNPNPPTRFEAEIEVYSLVDEDTGLIIPGYEDLDEVSEIDFAGLETENINIRVFTAPHTVGSVVVELNNAKDFISSQEPYLVARDSLQFKQRLKNGHNTLIATAYELAGGEGNSSSPEVLIFEVKNLEEQEPEKPEPEPEPNPNPNPGPPFPFPNPGPDPEPEPPQKKLPPEPKHHGTKTIRETIVIKKSGVYDFKKVLHVWKGKNWNCNGEKENGPQILRIEASNVTVKNFYFVGDGKTKGSNGLGDPIHIASCGSGQGNRCPANKAPKKVVLDGIFGHACEDMITVGTPSTRDITVQNSYLKPTPNRNNWDKTVQINFGKNINFYNNIFAGGARCIRYKPNTSGEVIGNEFYGCRNAVLGSSNDADISPMKNGPVTIRYKDNECIDCDRETAHKGSQVKYIRD